MSEATRLSGYLDSELTAGDALLVEQALADDPQLAEEFARLEQVDDLLKNCAQDIRASLVTAEATPSSGLMGSNWTIAMAVLVVVAVKLATYVLTPWLATLLEVSLLVFFVSVGLSSLIRLLNRDLIAVEVS